MAEKDTTKEREREKQNKLIDNRRERFTELLGDECEFIDAFVVHTHISPWDVKKLIEKDCSPELALQILL